VCARVFRLDLAARWDMDDYIKGHVEDALWTVASALDMVVRKCLGNPQDQTLVARTIVNNAWNSTLRLSAALGARPVSVVFDSRAHRALPMALGNLVNRKWQVAGVYDPSAKRFIERSETIHWPKTGKLTPRAWLSCDAGQKVATVAQGLSQCTPCPEGTFSLGGAVTACVQCSPGT
jgi:hypothetical protein